MQKIEQRIERLEAQHDTVGKFDAIVWRIIRPGDMACVAEHRIDLKTGKRTITQFIEEGAP